jgi:hypothetical protein
MNKVEKELHGYISGTERMSGFDSYDSYEGDMSYFDDSSSFDGDDFSYANGGSATAQVSDPYVIQYANTTTANVTAVSVATRTSFKYTLYVVSGNISKPPLGTVAV